MLYAFTDESYNQWFYLQGALVVDKLNLASLEQLVQEVKEHARQLGVDTSTEIHGHSIMQGVHGWEALAGKVNMRLSIYKHLLHGLAKLKVTLLIQGVAIDSLSDQQRTGMNPHLITYRNILDAIEVFAQDSNKSVLIISDRISYEGKIRSLLTEYQLKSTKGNYHSYLERIIKVEHVDSHLSAGVQLIDIALYIFNKSHQPLDSDSKAKREAKKLWEILRPIIRDDFPPRIWRP